VLKNTLIVSRQDVASIYRAHKCIDRWRSPEARDGRRREKSTLRAFFNRLVIDDFDDLHTTQSRRNKQEAILELDMVGALEIIEAKLTEHRNLWQLVADQRSPSGRSEDPRGLEWPPAADPVEQT
jgi:hypothetical protein